MILRGDFVSDSLRMSTNVQVLIPEQGKEPFRVAYLLHGLHGDQGTWLDNTMLPVYAKNYNIIFVMPEVGRSFYSNQEYGRKYYDYVSDELPLICKKIFNISAQREDTAVMGCSMGGYGSLRLALSKPDQFGFCGAISSACRYFTHILDSLREDPGPYLAKGPEEEAIVADLKAIYGEDLEYRNDYDIIELAKDFPADRPKPKIFATCGTGDDLREENLQFVEEMQKTDFDFTYEEWKGGHEWYFFNEALKRTLEFWQGEREK
jgi:S-formylglutathione hydrolase FrmB